MPDDQIEQMYEMIRNGEQMEQKFEGQVIKNFDQLIKMERNESTQKLNELTGELSRLEQEESKSAALLASKTNMENDKIAEILASLKNDATRIGAIENLLHET